MTQPAPVEVPRLPQEHPPVRLREQLAAYARSARPLPTGGRPFLIYGQGRTGSNLLGSLLGSHPDVRWDNEVLAARVRSPERYLDGLRARAGRRSFGCHVKRYHLTDVQDVADCAAFLRRAHEQGYLLIHLARRDTLRHMLSNFTLNATGRSHYEVDDRNRPDPVHVDVPGLLRWMAIRDRIHQLELADLTGLPVVDVVYEDDLVPGQASWDLVTDRVFVELGLPPHRVTTTLRKGNPTVLREVVRNYDELVDALTGTPWEALLDAPVIPAQSTTPPPVDAPAPPALSTATPPA